MKYKVLDCKLSKLGKGPHNIESQKQRLKGLCKCIESPMLAHEDSHEFSKQRIPGCLQAPNPNPKPFIQRYTVHFTESK